MMIPLHGRASERSGRAFLPNALSTLAQWLSDPMGAYFYWNRDCLAPDVSLQFGPRSSNPSKKS